MNSTGSSLVSRPQVKLRSPNPSAPSNNPPTTSGLSGLTGWGEGSTPRSAERKGTGGSVEYSFSSTASSSRENARSKSRKSGKIPNFDLTKYSKDVEEEEDTFVVQKENLIRSESTDSALVSNLIRGGETSSWPTSSETKLSYGSRSATKKLSRVLEKDLTIHNIAERGDYKARVYGIHHVEAQKRKQDSPPRIGSDHGMVLPSVVPFRFHGELSRLEVGHNSKITSFVNYARSTLTEMGCTGGPTNSRLSEASTELMFHLLEELSFVVRPLGIDDIVRTIRDGLGAAVYSPFKTFAQAVKSDSEDFKTELVFGRVTFEGDQQRTLTYRELAERILGSNTSVTEERDRLMRELMKVQTLKNKLDHDLEETRRDLENKNAFLVQKEQESEKALKRIAHESRVYFRRHVRAAQRIEELEAQMEEMQEELNTIADRKIQDEELFQTPQWIKMLERMEQISRGFKEMTEERGKELERRINAEKRVQELEDAEKSAAPKLQLFQKKLSNMMKILSACPTCSTHFLISMEDD